MCLVDTGCDRSIIPRRMTFGCDVQESSLALYAANGTRMDVTGETEMEIRIGSVSVFSRFVVTDNVMDPILGIDWLRANVDSWSFMDDAVII